MSANKNESTPVSFEVESVSFIMDTGSTDHVCRNRNLFIGNIVKCPEIDIKGIGGSLGAEGYGTIRFTIKDDHDKLHEMTIHNVLYIPNSPVNLFSPQRFAKDSCSKDGTAGSCLITSGEYSFFLWDESKYIKSIYHSKHESLPIMYVNEDFDTSSFFSESINPLICTVIKEDDTPKAVSFDDSGDIIIPMENRSNDPHAVMIEDIPDDASDGSMSIKPLLSDAIVQSDDSLSEVEEDVLDIQDDVSENQLRDVALDKMSNDDDIPQMDQNDLERLKDAIRTPLGPSQTEFLQWHIRLGHMPFTRMKRLTEKDIIPRKFRSMTPLLCPWCIFGK